MSRILAEYIWIGSMPGQPQMQTLRSKTKVLDSSYMKDNDFPDWNFDGSSTGQASGQNSEIIIKPRSVFKDPLRSDKSTSCYLVLCDTYNPDGTPALHNNRAWAESVFENDQKLQLKPWFGLEQEYFLMSPESNFTLPLGFPLQQNAREILNNIGQGRYYCSVGAGNAIGRQIAEEHMEACVNAGLKISGINAEVAPGQWEFQVGPCEGIEQGDHLWLARYLLLRIAEKHNVGVNFEPKPVRGDWNGSGCHMNYSTKLMREGGFGRTGLDYINEAIYKLSLKHREHMEVYGSGNRERMTGLHETASYDTFSDGVCNRGASIRRGTDTVKNEKGYFEDRRPSSNCDPYLITAKMYETTCLS